MIKFKANKDIKKGEWLVAIYDEKIEFAFNEEIGIEVEK